ncbi:hypothetical protein FF011L_39770 [Roseimaritima multifibrata]|uniref:GxxExxY protein n=1 Tax=Roseimaritima multifibrata TaxID=1930274 RepID=A0A517MJZ0_9BACT|nr:GxxExxY protein [Roseimaritima multifibrata]QDS95184.1 hypothetical protein FF011L_39770 [Roseimaritima multifibrata]
MPVKCEYVMERASAEAFAKLDYLVMGQAFKCHNQFGRLADERIYERNLVARLVEIPVSTARQVPVVVSHRSFRKMYFLDLIVSRLGLYELKTVTGLNNEHVAQLLNYLYLLDLPRGKLINFRSPKVQSRFVNAPLSREQRTSFSIKKDRFNGDPYLLDMTLEMVRDLGTALTSSLYQEVLVALLGGEDAAIAMLPMKANGIPLGKQRFHLASPSEGLCVTCFRHIPVDYEYQVRSLLRHSPLTATQWINIDSGSVTFKTIRV